MKSVGVSMLRILFLVTIGLLLSACVSPVGLGISEEQWRSYTPEQKEKIKSGYYEILKKRFHSEPKVASDNTYLHVAIFGGKVVMPPFSSMSDYLPVEFNVSSGECTTVKIKEAGSDKMMAMKACYQNNTLFLDPSRYDPSKRVGSIQLYYSPIWDRGFSYQNVSSSGYVHLTGVNVLIQKYSN
jgi:hypothetical protein